MFQELKLEFLCRHRKLIQENTVASESSRKKCDAMTSVIKQKEYEMKRDGLVQLLVLLELEPATQPILVYNLICQMGLM